MESERRPRNQGATIGGIVLIGLGLILQGERLQQGTVVRTGTYMLELGVIGFLAFAAFFELVLDLNHFGGGAARGLLAPAILIVVGLYLLVRRGPRVHSGA